MDDLISCEKQSTQEGGKSTSKTVMLPITDKELKHLINDTSAYIWRLEDKGMAYPEFGYDSRKELLEKLRQFEQEHFPQRSCIG